MSVSGHKDKESIKLAGLVEETKKIIEKGNKSPKLQKQESVKDRQNKGENGKNNF